MTTSLIDAAPRDRARANGASGKDYALVLTGRRVQKMRCLDGLTLLTAVVGAQPLCGRNLTDGFATKHAADWPRDDGGSRRPYAALAHCRIPEDAAPLEAWLDEQLDRRCGLSYFRQASPSRALPCLAVPGETPCRAARCRAPSCLATLRSLARPCLDEARDQLKEEWLGWFGFCDWSRYRVPPRGAVRAFFTFWARRAPTRLWRPWRSRRPQRSHHQRRVSRSLSRGSDARRGVVEHSNSRGARIRTLLL